MNRLHVQSVPCNKKSKSKKISIIHQKSQSRLAHHKQQAPVLTTCIKWPLKKGDFWLSSRFGPRVRAKKRGVAKIEMHWGLDMAAVRGTPVYASCDGVIIAAHYCKGYGNCIVINHGSGVTTRYAHLSAIIGKANEHVATGTMIGKVGATGNTRGKHDASHLHFEVAVQGKRYDPLFYLVW